MQKESNGQSLTGQIRALETGNSIEFPIERYAVVQNIATNINTERGCAPGDVSVSTRKNREAGTVVVTRVR